MRTSWLSKPAVSAKKVVRTGVERHGGLDTLVNADGVSGPSVRTADISVEDWDRVVNINLGGIFLISKHAIAAMLKRGKGTILAQTSAIS